MTMNREMRRKDRAMDEDFAYEVLAKCGYAMLATVNEDGTPHCVPISPGCAGPGQSLYFHCAKQGLKLENILRNSQVCISGVGDTHIPEGLFTTEYESFVLYGTAELVEDEAEMLEGLRLICQRYTPGNMDHFASETARSLSRTAVVRVSVDRITGKRKKYDSEGEEMKWMRR